MTNEEEVIDQMNEEIPAPLGKEKVGKDEASLAAHQKAAVTKNAPLLERKFLVGDEMLIQDIEMKVIKVDGMTVTFKRTDIVG